jgi:hypothetical protein
VGGGLPGVRGSDAWVLLSVLAFAVIGMHSLVADGPAPRSMASAAMTASVPAAANATERSCCPGNHAPAIGQPGHHHDLQHLCLTILIAAVVLLVGSLLRRRGQATAGHCAPGIAGHAGRA